MVLSKNTSKVVTIMRKLDLEKSYELARLCEVKRRSILLLIVITFFGSLLDMAGVAMIYPIGEFLLSNGDVSSLVENSKFWAILNSIFLSFNVQPSIFPVVFTSVTLLISRQIVSYIRVLQTSKLVYFIARRLRHFLIDHFFNAKLATQEQLDTGDYTNAITNETQNAAYTIIRPVEFLNDISLFLFYLTFMSFIAPQATLLVFVFLIPVVILIKKIVARVRILGRKIVKANSDYAQYFIERYRAARLIRLTRQERYELQKSSEILKTQEQQNVKASKLIAITASGVEPLILIFGLPLLVASVVIFNAELILVGMYFITLARLSPMVKGLTQSWAAYLKMQGAIEIIHRLIDQLDSGKERNSGEKQMPPVVSSIELKHVSFRYPSKNTNALSNISMRIEGSTMVGIVGPSGSGKSTLVDLLPLLREPTSGTIYLNGRNLNEFDINELRQNIAFVSQSPTFFQGTIAEQIGYGAINISFADIKKAAEMSSASEFIEKLDDGFNSKIGENGAGLSGGQRQRIELSRAIAAKASILILDEPTSNLDGQSAHQINIALQKIRQNTPTTIILIGHQLNAMQKCDNIIVLEDGKISDYGKYEQLIRSNEWFKATVNKQKL